MEENGPALYIGLYLAICILLFMGAALMLDSDTVLEKDRKWVGRVGLWSPLWPLLILYGVYALIRHAWRTVRNASKGE